MRTDFCENFAEVSTNITASSATIRFDQNTVIQVIHELNAKIILLIIKE